MISILLLGALFARQSPQSPPLAEPIAHFWQKVAKAKTATAGKGTE
jgi:hypothetical protein